MLLKVPQNPNVFGFTFEITPNST